MKTLCCFGGLLIVSVVASACPAQLPKASAGDWPWWRGPNFNNVAASGQQTPVAWSETENIVWKAAIPGRGHSSPTIVGDRVFLTVADEQAEVQSVLCFDRGAGTQLWKRDANRGGLPAKINHKNTHATSTVACDGKMLFAAFLNHDSLQLVALDLNGEPVWEQRAGKFAPQEYKNGYAASPLLYGSLVLIAGDFDGDEAFLAAFDRQTGKPSWRTSRPPRVNYPSPIVADIAGRHQLLMSGGDIVASYDPRSGKQLWKVAATTMATAGTMVWDGDLVFASGGYPVAETVGIRADGSGEIVWRNKQKCYEQSMLAVDGHLYAINDSGVALCWNAATGEERWRERLRGPISASPVLSGGNIFAMNELGTTWVYRANPEKFELVSQNQLGTETFATPAICGNQIFLRVGGVKDNSNSRQEMLYCIGVAAP